MRLIVAVGELVYQDITGKLDTVDGVRVYLLYIIIKFIGDKKI